MSEALTLVSDADKSDFVERAVLRAVQDLQAAQKLQGESVNKELSKLHSKIAKGDAASALGQMEARLQKCEKEQERLAKSVIAADNGFLTISALKAIEERLDNMEKFQEHVAREAGTTAHLFQELDKMRQVQETMSLEAMREEIKKVLAEKSVSAEVKRSKEEKEEEKVAVVARTEDVLKNEYALNGSVWDASIFIGMMGLGLSGSICLGVLWVVNILVQSVFCWVCWMVFTESDFNKQSIWGLKVWRWNSAHDVGNVNSLWPLSLASRICASDSSLHFSGQQALQLDLVSTYSPESFVGQLMCLLCLICFWTSLWSDGKDACKLLTGVLRCHGKQTVLHATQGGIQIQSLGLLRTAFVVLTAVLRAVVFAIIGAAGTIWLSNTASLGDLLLNAVALELVLSVDELLFQVLAPIRAKAMVASCLPLPIFNINTCTGLHVIAVLDMLTLLGAILIAYVSLVSETAEFVKQAEIALCGGATNFVYNIDPLGIVYVHDRMPTASDPGFTEDGFEQNYRIKAIEEVISGTPREDWKYALHEPDLVELQSKNLQSLPLLQEEFNKGCQDMLVEGEPRNRVLPLRAALQHAVNNKSLDLMWCSSSDLQPICRLGPQEFTAARLARLLCPVSCGCASPRGGVPSTEACPSVCEEKFRENLKKMNTCKDVDWQSDSSWRQWMHEAAHFVQDKEMKAQLTGHGCEALRDHPDSRQYCEGYKPELSYLKALVGACPESCGCREGHGECPEACSFGEEGTTTSLDPYR